ncbi:MAG: HAD-IA family hydrolase [Candidatus Nanoarchaeia archaeon]
MNSGIKAVVFDFDGMTYLTTQKFSDRLSKDFHLKQEDISPFFKNSFKDCQRGKKDLKRALNPYLLTWKLKKNIDELLDYWFEDGEINPEIIPIIKELKKKNILCILCTNNERYRMEYLKQHTSLQELFNLIIASYETGYLKPEREIFQTILKKTKLKPQEILFCDDKAEHISALKEFGFKTHQFTTIQEFKKRLNYFQKA